MTLAGFWSAFLSRKNDVKKEKFWFVLHFNILTISVCKSHCFLLHTRTMLKKHFICFTF
jgi:hypothetical protein